MELIIWFEKQKLSTKLFSPIAVKDVILNVRITLNKSDGNLILLSNEFEALPETFMILPNEKTMEFYLLLQQQIAKVIAVIEEKKIEDLIMKVTGANNKLSYKREEQKKDIRSGILSSLLSNQLTDINEPSMERLFNLITAIDGVDFMLPSNRDNNEAIEPNESSVQELKEMGFPEDRVRAALVAARNNMARATDILLGGEEE